MINKLQTRWQKSEDIYDFLGVYSRPRLWDFVYFVHHPISFPKERWNESYNWKDFIGLYNTYGLLRWWVHPVRAFKDWRRYLEIPVGSIVEDCGNHPMLVLSNDGDSVDGIRLTTGLEFSCSLFHCGLFVLTPEEIKLRLKTFHQDGERGLAMLNGWTSEGYSKFVRDWR